MSTNESALEQFNNRTDTLIQQYYDRGIVKKEVRSYEVSLWTLQDDFITVLKWSDVEQKGRIENGKLTLNIDGTQKLEFSIPMYYYINGELKENPNWYNTQNNNLMVGLRKIKVIFNKGTFDIADASKYIFEFIITKVTETHEKGILTCMVEAEGLAFQELGKIGYKINLSQDNFELIYKDWDTTGQWKKKDGTIMTTQPLETVDYWCEESDLVKYDKTKPINSRTWYYDVRMNWSSFEDGSSRARQKDKVYEESFVSSWSEDLSPEETESYKEKARSISVEHSNLYNITQTIAEKFEIFCRYEYLYDNNYHIIGRIVVFYNNFLNEDPESLITITYPYSSSKVEREMDSTNVTTKLFVLDVEDSSTLSGYHSIMDAPPNASREDYILNFDYLYKIGAITAEQYGEIGPYNRDMRILNGEIISCQQSLQTYEIQKPDLEAKLAVYNKSIDVDKEQISQNQQLQNTLDAKDGRKDGLISLSSSNPDSALIHTSTTGQKFLNFKYTNKGIDEGSLRIYKTLEDAKADENNNVVTRYKFNYDDYGNISTVSLLDNNELVYNNDVLTKLYLLYSYDPQLYYANIVATWQTKLAKDIENRNEIAKQLGPKSADDKEFDVSLYEDMTVAQIYNNEKGLYRLINEATALLEEKMDEKAEKIRDFERLMGAAIREGYWQPDDYNDYGDHHHCSSIITDLDITENSGQSAIIAWDSTLFDEEDDVTYKIGVEESEESYPCIDLNAVFGENIPSDLKDYTLVWKANTKTTDYDWDSIKDLQMFSVGSQALIKFIKYHNVAKPVLMIVGAKTFSDEQRARMMSYGENSGEARLEKYSAKVDNEGNLTITHSGNPNPITIGNNWIKSPNNMVYPRIKFSSLNLKTDSTNLTLKYDNYVLEVGRDYYVQTRNTFRNDHYYPEYYITIKPDVLITYGIGKIVDVDYILSNANTAIYLDAMKVSKENAWPKASYEVTTSVLDIDLTNRLYNALAQIVMVNDTELKFENVFGYISEVELDLDHCENDTIEVKNYKTKFEDLFSTIVAETEAMKQNGVGIANALSGHIPLSEMGVTSTYDKWKSIFEAYMDSHFDTSAVVRAKLASLFTEAGEIISASKKSIKQIGSITRENAEILGGFASNIANELTSQVYRSHEKPTSFKTGDIWIETDENGEEIGRYVATFNSGDLNNDRTGTGGFVRTFDGTLASITGAALNVNADDGIVDIEAENKINIKSGNNIYIAANEKVDIVGNKSVNIGGGTINITGAANALHENGEVTNYTSGGINIISTGIYFNNTEDDDEIGTVEDQMLAAVTSTDPNISKVLIHPTKIELASSDILMRGANKIEMVSSRGSTNDTSAIEISPDDGVWIGSGQGVRLFSGGFTYDETEDTLTKTAAYGASVELNSEHLILGYAEIFNKEAVDTVGSVILLDQNQIVMGIGEAATSDLEITGDSDTGLVGARFTQNSIGMTTYNNANGMMNTIIMNDNGITLGSSNFENATINLATASGIELAEHFNSANANGSYVRIASDGIELGSLADLYINTDNLKLQTHSRADGGMGYTNDEYIDGNTIFAIGSGFNDNNTGISGTETIEELRAMAEATQNPLDIKLVINQDGAYFKGDIFAQSGYFNGDVVANTLTAISENGKFIATSADLGFYSLGNAPILTLDEHGMVVNNDFVLSIDGELEISSGNLVICAHPDLGGNYFYVGESGDDPEYYIQYTQLGALEVKGDLVATTLTLGDPQEDDSYLTYDADNGLVVAGQIYAQSLFIEGNAAADWLSANMAIIGGWVISENHMGDDETRAASTVGMSNTNGTVFWAGGRYDESGGMPTFKVTNDGDVYLSALMVYDPQNSIPDDVGDRVGDYVRINFSGLNFKDAVSLNSGGSWSGTSFTATINLWGKINKSMSIGASFDIDDIDCTIDWDYENGSVSATGNVTGTLHRYINGVETTDEIELDLGDLDLTGIAERGWYEAAKVGVTGMMGIMYGSSTSGTIAGTNGIGDSLDVDASAVYDWGWNDCLAACTAVTGIYTRSNGITAYDADGNKLSGTYYLTSPYTGAYTIPSAAGGGE